MLYCERCSCLFDESGRCPLCRRRLGREVRQDDPVFLREEGMLSASILADVLRQAGVPFLQRQAVGVTPLVGECLGRYRFYVPFRALEAAGSAAAVLDEDAEDETEEDGRLPEDGADEPEA